MLECCGEELTDPSHKNSTVLYKNQNGFFFFNGHTIQSHLYEVLFIYLFLALLLGTWDLSSPTGDQTCALCTGNALSPNQQTTREAP